MSSAEQPLIKYCRNCRREGEVRFRLVGDTTLMRCAECNYWIRCDNCLAIVAVKHQCEKKTIEVL